MSVACYLGALGLGVGRLYTSKIYGNNNSGHKGLIFLFATSLAVSNSNIQFTHNLQVGQEPISRPCKNSRQ